MGVNPKVVAAISSAIGSCLQAEQEALLAEQQLRRRVQPPGIMSSPFALAGRLAAMEIRWIWQMRIPVRSCRF
jgi:hypothetical protein